MSRYSPRPYQAKAIHLIRQAWVQGMRRIVLVSPTGAGKTFMASEIIDGAVAKGNRVLFLAHRKELIDQCSKTLDEIGVDHGIIKSGHWRKRPHCPVQVASVQTLSSKRRCPECKDHPLRKQIAKEHGGKVPKTVEVLCDHCDSTGYIRRPLPEAKIVVIDETHRCLSPSYQEIIDGYPDAMILGLTATPWRLDGRGLAKMYQHLVATVQVQDLVDEGFLLPIRAFAPDLPDLSDVKTRRGDYDQSSISAIMNSRELVGNIVDHWHRLAEGQRTVVFASSVENSEHLVSRFRESGVAAEHLDGTMGDRDRTAVLGRLAEGTTRIVCNVDVLVEGYDLPSLGCVVLARPTKSLTRYLQQVGRGMRPHADQRYMVLIDHAGCVHEHGLPTDPRRWSLEDRKRKKKSEAIDAAPCVICEKCGALRPSPDQPCPACAGVQVQIFRGIVPETDDKLVELKSTYKCEHCDGTNVRLEAHSDLELKVHCRGCNKVSFTVDKHAARQASEARRKREYDRLRSVQQAKGFKPGWVSYRYRSLFGKWPPAEWR